MRSRHEAGGLYVWGDTPPTSMLAGSPGTENLQAYINCMAAHLYYYLEYLNFKSHNPFPILISPVLTL